MIRDRSNTNVVIEDLDTGEMTYATMKNAGRITNIHWNTLIRYHDINVRFNQCIERYNYRTPQMSLKKKSVARRFRTVFCSTDAFKLHPEINKDRMVLIVRNKYRINFLTKYAPERRKKRK